MPTLVPRFLIAKSIGATWYNLYSDGWVEQGGNNGADTTTFPKAMANTAYTVVVANKSTKYEQYRLISRTTTNFTSKNANSTTSSYDWAAFGLSDSGSKQFRYCIKY